VVSDRLLRQNLPVRYLTIVRHAKASPAEAGESDFERTLNKRGREQCEQLHEWASNQKKLAKYGPTTALVSSSARTRETFTRSFEGTPFVERVEFSDLIYNGLRDVTAEDLLIDLAAIDPVTSSLLVVAHNPTVHELMFSLALKLPKSISHEHYPLGGAYVLELPDDRQVGLARYDVVDSFIPD
jgi:phosphohistidine phosphatase